MSREGVLSTLIDQKPEPGALIEIADGVLMLRLPLPLRLNHVNVFILDDGDGWVVFDCGMNTAASMGAWANHLDDGRLTGRPIRRVIVSHFHPDHVGLAGWLCERYGAELLMTRTEWLIARMLTRDAHGPRSMAALNAHLARCGAPGETAYEMAASSATFANRVTEPPPVYTRLQAGDVLTIGGRKWVCRIGGGHAPEQAALWCEDDRLLLIGDQILPNISPNVSVWHSQPEENPLAAYLQLLNAQGDLPEDAKVLSAHGLPFLGLNSRAAWLKAHHDERLDALLGAFGGDPIDVWTALLALFPQENELDAHQKNFALGETLAHLNHLVGLGTIRRLDGALTLYERV